MEEELGEFEEEFYQEREVLTHDELETALQDILASALDEALVISGWTVVTEVVTPWGAKYLLPITKDEQPSWTTKGFLQEALDMLRSEYTAETVLELIVAARKAQEEDEE